SYPAHRPVPAAGEPGQRSAPLPACAHLVQGPAHPTATLAVSRLPSRAVNVAAEASSLTTRVPPASALVKQSRRERFAHASRPVWPTGSGSGSLARASLANVAVHLATSSSTSMCSHTV